MKMTVQYSGNPRFPSVVLLGYSVFASFFLVFGMAFLVASAYNRNVLFYITPCALATILVAPLIHIAQKQSMTTKLPGSPYFPKSVSMNFTELAVSENAIKEKVILNSFEDGDQIFSLKGNNNIKLKIVAEGRHAQIRLWINGPFSGYSTYRALHNVVADIAHSIDLLSTR